MSKTIKIFWTFYQKQKMLFTLIYKLSDSKPQVINQECCNNLHIV